MSILCVARWQSARDMIGWMCSRSVPTPKSPSYLARRHANAGLQLAAVMMARIRIIQRGTRGGFAPTPALWRAFSSCRPVRAMAVRKCSKSCQLFRAFLGRALFVRGMMHPYFSVGPSRRKEASVAAPAGWLFWNLVAHPLLGEEDSTSPPRWL
jgi:hypothetical protein